MNIDSAFPSKYLKASDLGDVEPVVTIDRVEIEGVGQKKELKPVLYFRGKDKGVVMNKTNANKIAALLGSRNTDAWRGQRIRLYATETEFAGETVECIRVKAAGNGHVEPPPPPPPPDPVTSDLTDDDIPFAWVLPLLLPALGALHFAAGVWT